MVERRPGAEEEDRLARLGLLHRVDEERDRLPLVGLDDAVVVGQVVARNPVGVEGRIPPADQQPAGQAGEAVLVRAGPEVRAGEEEQRVGGRHRVGEGRSAEGAGVVRRLLGELGGDVARGRGDLLCPRSAPPERSKAAFDRAFVLVPVRFSSDQFAPRFARRLTPHST